MFKYPIHFVELCARDLTMLLWTLRFDAMDASNIFYNREK